MASGAIRKPVPEKIPELHNGDRMTREEFHQIYEQMPESFKAELIGGIVYVASPLRLRHATNHPYLSTVVTTYAGNTLGAEVCDNATILLGDEGEPQPDLFLRILPEFGGRSRTTLDEYVEGPPEWIAEIAHSTRALDLHGKRLDYQRYGVLEYLVVCLQEQRLRWFDLQADKEMPADDDGIIRFYTFPGLWLCGEALFAKDFRWLMATLEQGLATSEHAAFVKKLEAARRKISKKPKK